MRILSYLQKVELDPFTELENGNERRGARLKD